MVNCAWLIFIRSSSVRLPGKALMKIGENIMLEHIVNNLQSDCISGQDIYLCTSSSFEDDRLLPIASKLGINIIRGDENNPIERYWMNSQTWDRYSFVSRVNGDSPMYIGRLGLEALNKIEKEKIDPDIITNIRGSKRHFPSGLSLEIYKKDHLDQLLTNFNEYRFREHMSDLIQLSESQNGQILSVQPFPIVDEYTCKLSVDTYDDYQAMNKIVREKRFQAFLDYYRAIPLAFEWN